MLIPPWNTCRVNSKLNEVIAAVKYQTLWTTANWTEEVKMEYIMQSKLPKDFNLSVYYAVSRELLIQDSARKAKARTRVKKVGIEGCTAEDFRVKRLLEKSVDLVTLSHAQLLILIEKLQATNCSQQQELNNYEQLKNVNKNTANT